MSGFRPLLGLELMALIRPQFPPSHTITNRPPRSSTRFSKATIYVMTRNHAVLLNVIDSEGKPGTGLYVGFRCMTISMYCLYVGFDYTYIEVALHQIK